MKYAGMATQFMATLAVAFFIGIKTDRYFKFSFPIVTLLLPLIMLIVTFWKIIKDSSPKK